MEIKEDGEDRGDGGIMMVRDHHGGRVVVVKTEDGGREGNGELVLWMNREGLVKKLLKLIQSF